MSPVKEAEAPAEGAPFMKNSATQVQAVLTREQNANQRWRRDSGPHCMEKDTVWV